MSMPEFSWFVVIDSVIYLSLILVAYFVIKKVFARSNIGVPLIVISVLNVIANYFELTLFSNLCISITIALFVAVVVSNDQKINKLLKRRISAKESANVHRTFP